MQGGVFRNQNVEVKELSQKTLILHIKMFSVARRSVLRPARFSRAFRPKRRLLANSRQIPPHFKVFSSVSPYISRHFSTSVRRQKQGRFPIFKWILLPLALVIEMVPFLQEAVTIGAVVLVRKPCAAEPR